MPAYNAEKFINKAINSILEQSYDNWELLICDDASTDSTRTIIDEIANRDSRIIVSHNSQNENYLKFEIDY